MSFNKAIITESFKGFQPMMREFGVDAWELLLSGHPEAKEALEQVDRDECIEIFNDSITFFVENLDFEERLRGYFRATGTRYYHQGFGPDHYYWVKEAWLEVVAHYYSSQWEEKLREPWQQACEAIVEYLSNGVAEGQSVVSKRVA